MLAISYARRYLSTSKTLSSRIKIANKIPKNYASSKKPEQYVDYNIPDSPRPLATKDLDLHKNAEIINRKKQEANMELESSSLFKKLVFAKEYKIHRVAGIVLFTIALWFHPDFGAYAVWFPIISGIAIFYEVYLIFFQLKMIGRSLIFQRVGSCLGGKQYSKYSYRYLRTNPIMFQQPPKEPTNQNNETIDKQSPADDDEHKPKQSTTTTTTKINLYQSQNELSPTRRMDAIMKKKNTAMTDDESTPIGKAKAAGKDLLAIGFSAGAIGLLGLVGYYMYTTYVQKKPRDYAYEKLAKIIKDSEDLEDNIGIDFEVQKNKPGTTSTGRVEANAIEMLKDEYKTHNLQCLIIQCYVHVKSTGRKGQIQGFFVKKEEESDDEWFPMFAICTLDYESRNYGKRVILEDNRKKLQESELEIVKANIDSDSELKSIEREERRKTLEFKKQLEAGSTETIDALGLGTFDAPGNKTESKLGKNFAADLKSDEVGSQDSKKSESGDGEWSARRKGPRF